MEEVHLLEEEVLEDQVEVLVQVEEEEEEPLAGSVSGGLR